MKTRVKLSAAPIDWGVAELVEGNPSPNQILECARDTGYSGCELGTHGYFGFSTEDVRSIFTTHSLLVSASWYDVDLAKPLSPESDAEIDLICSLLQANNASVINISDKIVPERVAVISRTEHFPETWWSDEDWKQVPSTLLQIHEIVSRRGVTVAFHQHVGTHVESQAEVRRLFDVISGTPIMLCLDTGHLLLGGSDPIALLNDAGDRVIHVHAKDVDGPTLTRLQAGEIDYFAATGEGLYSDLGAGIVDWQELKRGLNAIKYHGWVVAEQDRLLVPGSRIPFDANKRNAAFLKDLLDLP